MGSSMMGQLPLRGCRNHGSGIVWDRVMLLKEKLFRPFDVKDFRQREMLRFSRRLLVSTSSSVGFEDSSRCQYSSRWRHEHPQHNHRYRQFSSSTRALVNHRFSTRAEPLRNPLSDKSCGVLGNRPKAAATRHLSSSHHSNGNSPLLTFSSITDMPLDSTVMEKPYTVILMEDDVSESFYEYNEKDSGSRESNNAASWQPFFRSKIPRDYGMSFGSISLQLLKPSNGSTGTTTSTAPISKALEALKASSLPTMADALLVARGPCSSLCAQYYLESFSLKGLVMIDPILFGESSGSSKDEALQSMVSEQLYSKDPDSFDRFRSQRLLVEPNSVPMMVVRTVSDDHEYFASWRSCAQHVADRHGDLEGPYGSVPVVDLAMSNSDDEEHDLTVLLDHIDTWIDEDLQW